MRKISTWVLSDQPHLRTVHQSYLLRRKMVHCTFMSTSTVSTISLKRIKKGKTVEVRKVVEEWEIWDKEEEAAKSEVEAKKLVPERFHK